MDDARVSLDPASPRHVAIIMDGNGRWANARGLPRTLGHRQGAEAVRRCVAGAIELGIPFLTLFGFSSENWRRPTREVEDLMGLLRRYLQRSEEHTSELQSLMRISYAVFCLKKKNTINKQRELHPDKHSD